MLEDIKKTLWATADKLRANMDAAEYKHLVLGLIFVKYISDTFAARRAELTTRLTNPADDYFFANATPADLEQELDLLDLKARDEQLAPLMGYSLLPLIKAVRPAS